MTHTIHQNLPQPHDDDDEIRKENELLRAKLTAEFGMQLERSKLPPKLENQWLNYVYEFENAFAKADKVKVYDHIGKPNFKNADTLENSEFNAELERLLNIMAEHNIELSCICDYSEETIYRFITEELFEQEIEAIQMENVVCTFIYEQFYPNHEHDIKQNTAGFVERLLSSKSDKFYDEIYLAEYIMFKEREYDKDAFAEVVEAFHEAWKDAELDELKFNDVEFDTEKEEGLADAQMTIKVTENNGNMHTFKGRALFGFEYDGHIWCLNFVKLPGFGY